MHELMFRQQVARYHYYTRFRSGITYYLYIHKFGKYYMQEILYAKWAVGLNFLLFPPLGLEMRNEKIKT